MFAFQALAEGKKQTHGSMLIQNCDGLSLSLAIAISESSIEAESEQVVPILSDYLQRILITK